MFVVVHNKQFRQVESHLFCIVDSQQMGENVQTIKRLLQYIHLGPIRAIWASVVCNLDQSHDWLHGRNLVGNTGEVSPTFSGGVIICHVPPLFSL